MSTIFVHGLNSKAGGGKSILNSYLKLLQQNKSTDSFIVLTPYKKEYEKYSCDSVKILDIHPLYKIKLFSPLFNHFILPRLLHKLKVDALFNFADIAVPTDIPQIYLFDWAYAVYPDSIAWKRMDLMSFVYRKLKLFFFNKYLNYPSTIIAQTQTMKERLASIYGLQNIVVVPNAVALDSLSGGGAHDFKLPKDKKKLLYLTHYYPHKNLEVLILLAAKIKRHSLPYCFVVTLEATQHAKAKIFLNTIEKRGLGATIINVGSVPMEQVPALYSQTDALLMPTLLESFSGSYIEAMHHGRTIFTSNFDFARDVCGDAAFYFNPLDVDSILDSILFAYQHEEVRSTKIAEGKRRLTQLSNWEQTFAQFQEILRKNIVYGHTA